MQFHVLRQDVPGLFRPVGTLYVGLGIRIPRESIYGVYLLHGVLPHRFPCCVFDDFALNLISKPLPEELVFGTALGSPMVFNPVCHCNTAVT